MKWTGLIRAGSAHPLGRPKAVCRMAMPCSVDSNRPAPIFAPAGRLRRPKRWRVLSNPRVLIPALSRDIKKPLNRGFLISGGEGGIRTRGTVSPYTRFPGEHLRPLSHLSELFVPALRRGAAGYYPRPQYSIKLLLRKIARRLIDATLVAGAGFHCDIRDFGFFVLSQVIHAFRGNDSLAQRRRLVRLWFFAVWIGRTGAQPQNQANKQ